MEYVEHDLRELLEYQRHPQSEQAADNQQQQQLRSLLTLSEVKQLMLQLLSAIDYLHYNYIVHRDVKTSNLLLSNEGFLKLADFGLARRLADPLPAAEFSESNSGGHLTPLVVTLWYRAPEILLGSQYYGFPVDLWSVGCVMAELINDGHALFPGQSELEQLNLVCEFACFQ
jgi:cell division cycle 2-like protein